MKERLAVLGVDAWWLDATEPDIHSNLSVEERAYRMGPTALGPGAAFFNSFPLVHAEGVYQGHARDAARRAPLHPDPLGLWRHPAHRLRGVVGRHRLALGRSEATRYRRASISRCRALPNWTHDIGGFALEDRYTNQEPAHLDEWRELNLRWFQFGAFTPLFRSHGEAPQARGLRDRAGGLADVRIDGMVSEAALPADALYLHAGGRHVAEGRHHHARSGDGFPARIRRFGASPINICSAPPSSSRRLRSSRRASGRSICPPGASWYDFYSGALNKGGQSIAAAAPYERMPLFVRAGSIVPVGPEIEYTREKPDAPITLNVYTGADGSFSLYQDDGVSHQYEKGAFARIPDQL